MGNGKKAIKEISSSLNFRKRLGDHAEAFLAEATLVNLARIKIMSRAALLIFSLILIFDIVLYLDGKWDVSPGYRILASSHAALIVFLAFVQLVCFKRYPENPRVITPLHGSFVAGSLAFVLIGTSFIALGDVLNAGSIAAYLGMVFAYASIFILTNGFGLFLYGLNLGCMISLLIIAHTRAGLPVETRVINAAAFTIAAYVMSRVVFYYHLKDFSNRLMINRQTVEIERQNERKEKLIRELQGALSEVKTLRGFLPICSNCKKIRDDQGYWQQIEQYIQEHSEAEFSHGLCPECLERLYPSISAKYRK